ncbi:XRE family transcriptional regulator [Streptomyces sp. NBC_00569]|uniref:XRE family transcriptional regulator n=1 Tax=Streptomyces sp. NBC_00569 TaxID=2975780 RepID=UPI002E7FCE17|nr:XRE family transcriptional regulator [Streptomyces sp. NBC_00569]WUB94359.1 XRE family transcriptional regulator [Streptomyces sp. NBC_00569]
MPRWRALPDELDPQVREFASQLRRLVDRSGLSIAAVADRTGYSKTSWERYLNGRLLAPKRAIVTLAEVTGTNPVHLTTMWELAERAWSRSEMRHDMTMEAIRISQARAALGEFGPTATKSGKNGGVGGGGAARPSGGGATGVAGPAGVAPTVPPQGRAPLEDSLPYGSEREQGFRPGERAGGGVPYADGAGAYAGGGGPGPAGQPGTGGGSPDRQRRKRRLTMFLAGVVGALVVIAAAVYLTGAGKGEKDDGAKPQATPTSSAPELPAGVRCSGKDCTGKDPEAMGCGGEFARTTDSVLVGQAKIEVRYSKTCGAAWARITQAAPGDEVRIQQAGATGVQKGIVNADLDAYTPMVAVTKASEAKACATLKAGQKGCTQ